MQKVRLTACLRVLLAGHIQALPLPDDAVHSSQDAEL